MAGSRKPGHIGRDPFQSCPVTPGSLGINDAASPSTPFGLIGDTPGVLGCNDHAAPEGNNYRLGISALHVTLTPDKDLLLWDYDPGQLLHDPKLSPSFVEAAHAALAEAVRIGLRPKVHEAYRSPKESDRQYQRWKAKKGGRAAAGWRSCHNYGLAMDVWLYDRKGKWIDNHVKGWYVQYKLLAKAARGFVWGESFGAGDADHFEFHPNWSAGANGDFLLQNKAWAQQAANDKLGTAGASPSEGLWMPFLWWAGGAGGFAPPAAFLTKNPPPGQSTAKSAKKG